MLFAFTPVYVELERPVRIHDLHLVNKKTNRLSALGASVSAAEIKADGSKRLPREVAVLPLFEVVERGSLVAFDDAGLA